MKKIVLYALLIVGLMAAVIVPTVACGAVAINVTAREGILIAENGEVLFEHNSTEKRPIASMTKIMTLLCTYDAINDGKATLDDQVVVSSNAASMGGSQVFLEANGCYKMENLIKSIVVCSANDSCVAVAEHIAGSVGAFVKNMNQKAVKLGLENTHFENCTGLPAVSQFSCAKDVAVMLQHLVKNEHYFSCSKIWMEDFVHPSGRVTGMTNTNKLIRFYEGCDGGKTGFTNEAQHCLAATAKRGDMRVIAVVVGASDSKVRFKEASDMFNYAFANFENKCHLRAEEQVATLKVDDGKKNAVGVVAEQHLCAFGKKGENKLSLQLDLPQSIRAPIAQGDSVGVAKLVDGNGNVISSCNLVANASVQCKSYWDYVGDIVAK